MIWATEKPRCKDVIEACDKALAEKNKTLELADLAIKGCKDNNARLQEENERLTLDNSSFWHNPLAVFIIGAATGTIAYSILHK